MLKPLAFTFLLSVTAIGSADATYTLVGNDIRCRPRDRIFKTRGGEPLTLDQCRQLCYNVEGCQYFSFGDHPADADHVGQCHGCTAEAANTRPKIEDGFDSYRLDSTRSSPMTPAECLDNVVTFPTNGCDYEAILEGLDDFLMDEYWRCPALKVGDIIVQDVIDGIFSTTEAAKTAIDSACSLVWENGIPGSAFQTIDSQFNDDFMQEYLAGDTDLNTMTGFLNETSEGVNIAIFRNESATDTVLGSISTLENCNYNSIMCCFGRDRQPDDDGNCEEPLDENCVNADPGDNTNLCYTNELFAFPEKSEGAVHCHGLAWGDDENSFANRLRFNNFFYISLFDHLYTRGYVETMVDSDDIPMCGCIEDMPKVSRADCSQVEATQTFQVTYMNGGFSASVDGTLNVEFEKCKGINPGDGESKNNNDLAAHVYRLNQQELLSETKMLGVFDTLFGWENSNDRQNEAACEAKYSAEFNDAAYPINVGFKKCPRQGGTRLFKIGEDDPVSLEECQQRCSATASCNYFTIGLKGKNYGVCLGCTAAAILEDSNGMNTYELP